MDIDEGLGLPGGDIFEDVTALFEEAAKEMNPEETLLTDGFTFMDAMSAFEIGEPRMDTGMLLEQDDRPPFDPLAPLLPEEICWIIDRSFACMMGWFTANTLSQTVYTLQYVLSLQDINPDLLPLHYFLAGDPFRPLELVTTVLRPAVFAMLKSCDLVWRELSKKRVHDMEDWQSEKCEVTLLEGVPVEMVLRKLDEAYSWLRDSELTPEWVDAICDRLALHKTLLQLFNASHVGNLDDIRPLCAIVRNILRRARARPSQTPSVDSPALLAFDPRVTKRLHTVMPTRELELPPQDAVWDHIEQLLDDWENVAHLRENHTLLAWQVNGSHRVWLPENALPIAYIRSLNQRMFTDNQIVLGDYSEDWIVEQFFWETLGLSYDSISEVMINTWAGPGMLSLQEMESHVVEVVSGFVRSFWFNPPRRRRHLMKSVSDWQLLQDAFVNLTAYMTVSSPHATHIVTALPAAAAIWKLTVAREIILAGFQQELYTAYERPLAYWFVVQIVEQHIETLDQLKSIIPEDSFAWYEAEFQLQFLAVLQSMCLALLVITSEEPLPSRERMSLNFKRRYKWLVAPNEENPDALLWDLPSLEEFYEDLSDLRKRGESPAEHLLIAKDALSSLPDFIPQQHNADREYGDRLKFVQGLERLNDELLQCVRRGHVPNSADAKLRWDPSVHPWFPVVAS